MNKITKRILVAINFSMLVLGIFWYLQDRSYEPLLVCFGQAAALIGLLTEERVSKIITRKVKGDSKVTIDIQSGDNVHTSDIEGSVVNIKSSK